MFFQKMSCLPISDFCHTHVLSQENVTCMEGDHISHQFVKGEVPVQLTGGCTAAALNANKNDNYGDDKIMSNKKREQNLS